MIFKQLGNQCERNITKNVPPISQLLISRGCNEYRKSIFNGTPSHEELRSISYKIHLKRYELVPYSNLSPGALSMLRRDLTFLYQ